MSETSSMDAIILAGGKGTRISSVASDIPKPLIEVGGKAVIHHQVELLQQNGFRRVFFLINHLSQKIRDYFSDLNFEGMELIFIEEEEPLGTAGGLCLLKEKLSQDFFVFYGDVMVNLDLERLAKYHQTHSPVASLVTHPNDHPYDSDLIEVDSNWSVTRLLSKKGRSPDLVYFNIVNAALYVLSKDCFEYIRQEKLDLFQDVFPRVLESGKKLQAYQTFEYLKDMGTPDRLEKVRRQYQHGVIQRKNYKQPQPVVFLDRDGTLNRPDGLISKPSQLQLFDFTGEALHRLNESEYLSICVTNQPVIARNLCDFSELELIHKKLSTELGRKAAYLDGLYFCPHHPDSGYPEERPEYKIQCDCRKPAPGLVQQAAEDFPLDLSSSWVVGDRTADLQLAKNIGAKSILVETGDAGLDKKYEVLPDYRVSNLAGAVDMILEQSR